MNTAVFLSYSSKDIELVDRLKASLQAESLETVDPTKHESEMWGASVQDHLRDIIMPRVDGVLLLLSKNYISSRWCQRELSTIEESCKESLDAPLLLPLRVDDSLIPEQLRDRVYLDLRRVSLQEVAKIARQRLSTRPASESRLAALSDEDLYRRFLESRDPVLINLLFERLYPTVRASCFRYGLTTPDAEDVAQDTLVSLLRKVDSLTEVRNFEALVRGLTRNSTVRLHRRNALRRNVPFSEDISKENQPVVQPDHEREHISKESQTEKLSQLVDVAREALEQLPSDERELVKLHLVEGMTDHALARLFSVSVSVVRVRLHRVLNMLRKELRHSRSYE